MASNPPSDLIPGTWQTTGRARLRSTWLGFLRLELEETSLQLIAKPGLGRAIGMAGTVTRWRRARRGDLVTLAIPSAFRGNGPA